MSIPTSVSMRRYISYLQSQEDVPCCTASATLLAAETIMAIRGIRMNFSRLYLYYTTRKLKDRLWSPGAELRDALEALSLYGSPPERFWPFTPNRKDRIPHQQAVEEAIQYKVLSYKEILPDEYKSYLSNEIPIIIGIRTGRQFWNISGPLDKHFYKPVNNIDNLISNGHAVTIIGYDDELNGGSWIVANSLGPRWGDHGFAAIPYLCNVDIGESYVITNFAGINAGKKISEN